MKVIHNSIIPFFKFTYINLFGVLFTKKNSLLIRRSVLNHESIHTEQYKDLGYILYLPLYILEWIVKIPFGWFYTKAKYGRKISNIAYRSISFEQEAYYNQYDYDYLNKRKRYSWVKYIFTMYDPDKEIQRVGTEIYI